MTQKVEHPRIQHIFFYQSVVEPFFLVVELFVKCSIGEYTEIFYDFLADYFYLLTISRDHNVSSIPLAPEVPRNRAYCLVIYSMASMPSLILYLPFELELFCTSV